MRAIVQRVSKAHVMIDNTVRASIEKGIVVYVCFAQGDTQKEGQWLARKLLKLRIFSDEQHGKFTESLQDCNGSALIIPNFTLYAEVKNGTRPSFSSGIGFDDAKKLFEMFIEDCATHMPCFSGVFGASMYIDAVAAGPVNIIIDVPTQQ